MSMQTPLGTLARSLREAAQMSQADVAKVVGMTPGGVQAREKGRTHFGSPEALEAFLSAVKAGHIDSAQAWRLYFEHQGHCPSDAEAMALVKVGEAA